MGVGSKDSVPADFPKKNSGLAPEGLSILAGTGAGHRPLWRPTMALKIKIPGEPVGHPGASFPVPTRLASGKCGSICEGRGRPRMISTTFDPAFLSLRKGVARRPDLAITCQSFIRSCHKAHAVLWHLLSLCGERRQRRRIICRLSGYSFVGPENQPAVPNAGDCLPLRRSRPEAHTCHLCCI